MKKLVTLLLATALFFSFASCKKNEDEAITTENETVITDENTNSENAVQTEIESAEVAENSEDEITETEDETKTEQEIAPETVNPELSDTSTAKIESEVFSGDYYMVLHLSNKDDEYNETSSMDCTYAVSSENNFVRIVMSDPQMDFSMIITPEVSYTLDNSSKQYVEGIHELLTSLAEVAGRIRIGSLYEAEKEIEKGMIDIDGETYSYEAFRESETQMSKYCFDEKGNLKYVIFTLEGLDTVIDIVELTSEIPQGIFEIPADYTMYESVNA